MRGLDSGLAAIEKQLLAWGVILMAVNTLGNVFARIAFSGSLFFSEELNQFLILLITFVGTSAAARQGRHIRMSALTDMLPTQGRRLFYALIQSVTAVVLAALSWYAISYILRAQALGNVTPSLQIPIWITLLWLPLGLGIASLQFLLAAFANLRSDIPMLARGVREDDEADIASL
jgi:TRAP-type C4-dicarboxylate transport system permease small subunit